MKIKCIICKKIKEHYAKGKCMTCYKRILYRALPLEEKKRRYTVAIKYRLEHKEKWNTSMRNLMRKRLNIQPKNFRLYANEIQNR